MLVGINARRGDHEDSLSDNALHRETDHGRPHERRKEMSTILIIVLVLLLVGVLPTWPHSANWGYFPSGGLGLVLLILIILVLTGRL